MLLGSKGLRLEDPRKVRLFRVGVYLKGNFCTSVGKASFLAIFFLLLGKRGDRYAWDERVTEE